MVYTPDQYTGPTEIVPLHNHTVFSALDGVATPEQYAKQCADRKYPAMSATEHGHMASVPDMYLAFKKVGVKYIPGCEIYFNNWEPERQRLINTGIKIRSKEWQAEHPEEAYRIGRNRHLTLLCKNKTGFENLMKLTTQAYDTGLFGMGRMQFNRIWFDKLCEFKEGLICLSGCLNGPISHELRFDRLTKYVDGSEEPIITFERSKQKMVDDAVIWVKKFRQAFGEDFYIEVQMPGIPDDYKVFRFLVVLADKFRINTVLTNDCHYLNRQDFILQKIMMAVAQDVTIDSPDLFHVNSDEQFMKSRAELWATFKNGQYGNGIDDRKFEEMCDNTLQIAEKCEVLKIDSSPKIPEMGDAESELKRIVISEMRKRGLDKSTKKFMIDGREVTYAEQAAIELHRFIEKGFASYFLITRDLIQYGKRRGWPFSPRGSAGGSLVCFLLDIHVLNPMLWGLSFDRFLSPSRGGFMLNVEMSNEIRSVGV